MTARSGNAANPGRDRGVGSSTRDESSDAKSTTESEQFKAVRASPEARTARRRFFARMLFIGAVSPELVARVIRDEIEREGE